MAHRALHVALYPALHAALHNPRRHDASGVDQRRRAAAHRPLIRDIMHAHLLIEGDARRRGSAGAWSASVQLRLDRRRLIEGARPGAVLVQVVVDGDHRVGVEFGHHARFVIGVGGFVPDLVYDL